MMHAKKSDIFTMWTALVLLLGCCMVLGSYSCSGARPRVRSNASAARLSPSLAAPQFAGPPPPVSERNLGWLTLRRLPTDWRLVETKRIADEKGDMVVFDLVPGDSALVKVVVYPTRESIDMDKATIRGLMTLMFQEQPLKFTEADFVAAYPNERAVVAACAALQPGDPTDGGRGLSITKQKECVLSVVCARAFRSRVPTAMEFPGFVAHASVEESWRATNTEDGNRNVIFVSFVSDLATDRTGRIILLVPYDRAFTPDEDCQRLWKTGVRFLQCIDVRTGGAQ